MEKKSKRNKFQQEQKSKEVETNLSKLILQQRWTFFDFLNYLLGIQTLTPNALFGELSVTQVSF